MPQGLSGRQIARRFLMWAGFKCEVVADGSKCVERVKASAPFDLILMDCQVDAMLAARRLSARRCR